MTLTLSGLASGLDTESIVTQLMSVESAPRTRLVQQDTKAAARQAQLKDVQAKLTALRDAATALSSVTTWNSPQALASSDTARIGVRALGSTAPGARLIEVSRLAASAQHAYDYTASPSASTIDIGAFSLAVDADSTVETVASAINARNDSPVSALVAGGKLVLTSKTSGAAGDVTLTSPLAAENLTYARAGADAQYTLDGVAKTSTSNVITDAVLGAELTLKSTTTAPVGVTVGDPGIDPAAVRTKVQAFVTAYNSAVDLMRAKVAEKTVKGATTQSDQLKGLFNGDSLFSGMLTSMRSQVRGLQDAGISTGGAAGGTSFSADGVAGHLVIDDTKLTAALAADPAALRTRLGDLTTRMTDVIGTSSGSPIANRLTSEDSVRKRLADSMARIDVRLADKEKHLRAQFTAMESSLASAQAAQARLSAQLGALG